MSNSLKIVQKRFPNVKTIVDGLLPINVEVKSQDVKTSKKKNHEDCAMAVACKRKLNLDGIIISVSKAYLIKGTKAVRFAVPESVSREIVSFDRGSDSVPGDYSLRPVEKCERLGSRLDRKHNRKSKKTGSGERPIIGLKIFEHHYDEQIVEFCFGQRLKDQI